MHPPIFEALENIRFAAGLPPLVLKQLQSLAARRTFAKGEVVFREGEHCDNVYLVASGTVALDMHVHECGAVRLLTVGAGELLGWTPLFGSDSMTATATALEVTCALEFPGAQLRELCESNHEIGYRLMRQAALALSHRLVATRLQLLDIYPGPV